MNHKWPDHHASGDREMELLARALAEPDWSHSNLSNEFEKKFADYIGSRHALLVPSGTMAVYLSLVALGIKEGQEVVIPGITWPSVVYAIIKAGGIPVTVDINRDTLCMDPTSIRSSITSNTFAILATHIFGSQCDMVVLSQIAEEYEVKLVEDAAQSLGGDQAERRCGAWGVTGAFSLNDRKILACGEGGVIVTDNSEVFEELRKLQLIQPVRDGRPRSLPGTYKVSEFQAAVAIAQLERLDAKLQRMAKSADTLTSIIASCEGVSVQNKPVTVGVQSYYNYCILYRGPFDVDHLRVELSRKLNLKVSAPYRPISDITDLDPSFRKLPTRAIMGLRTIHQHCQEAYFRTCIRLPNFSLLATQDEVEEMGRVILDVFAQEGSGI